MNEYELILVSEKSVYDGSIHYIQRFKYMTRIWHR